MKQIGFVVLTVLFALIVGGLITYLAFPQTITVTKTVTNTVEVPVEKIVTNTVKVPVAVDYKQKVADAFLVEIADDRDLRKCGGDNFDAEDITIDKVKKGFTVTENTYGELTISNVDITLSYNGDCYDTFDCKINTKNDLICDR